MADKKQKCDCPPEGAPAWMSTFADLMSLLLTFFVLLLSFSTIAEPEKFSQAMMSIRGAFSIFEGNIDPITIDGSPPTSTRQRRLQRIATEVRRKLQIMGRAQEVELKFEEGGLKITLPSQILFGSGSALLEPSAEPLLREVAEILAGVPDIQIEVRGHTDNIPVSGGGGVYRDNYDLSYGRAKSVTGFLTRMGPIPMTQIEMVPLGPTRPVATNTTPDGRAKNRRVELFVRPEGEDAPLQGIADRLQDIGAQPAPTQVQ